MPTSAAERYLALSRKREHYLRQARNCAALTVPWLVPPEGWTGDTDLPEPEQGFGARLVLNLASRLMIAMYPPGMNSFRLDIPSEILAENAQYEEDEEVEKQLTQIEDNISAEIERVKWRQPTVRTMLHLIVAGNAVEQMMDDNSIRTFGLDQFVTIRDGKGNEKEIILKEMVSRESVEQYLDDQDGTSDLMVEQYTWCKRQEDMTWTVHQEVNNKVVTDSEGEYQILPFRALRWTAVDGEDYGRSKCVDHFPDLKSIDGLSKSALDGAAMAARNIIMTRPEAGTNLQRRVSQAKNGDVVSGNPEDVTMMQFTNVQGMQLAQAELESRKNELAHSFLLVSSIQRDGERVTATEIRKMAEELEGVLGGVYSLLTADLQGWRVKRLIFQMQDQNKIPDWPEGMIEPTILTGLEALGREQDVTRVTTATQMIAGLPEEALIYVDWKVILSKLLFGLQLPSAVRSEQEVQQIQQQRIVQQAAATGGEAFAKSAAQQQAQQQ